MRYEVYRSVEWPEPFVKVRDDKYCWITLGRDGVIRIPERGPLASVVQKQLLKPSAWMRGDVACRRIGDIDLRTMEYSLEAGESLESLS